MDENLKELEELRAENERLKEKNDKLYKDCVSFAKRIKASENDKSKVEDLEKEIEDLKAQLSRLETPEKEEEIEEETDNFGFGIESEVEEEPAETPEAPAPIYSYQEDDFGEQTFPTTYPETEVSESEEVPKNHSTHKKSPFRTFIRVLLWIFLVISLIIGLVSGTAYLFSTTYEEYAVGGCRFASVYNSSAAPTITKDDVILIKYSDFDGIELNSPVVTTKNTRSVGTLVSVDVIDGVNIATIKDRSGTYKVNEKQFIGQVKFKIPYLGKVVNYACANQYNYLAIVVSAILVFLALLLLIPSNKAKNPKFGRDYNVEDFTI